MLASGADAFRLNFSHGDHASHARLVRNIRAASKALARPVTIIQDLQGPRFRVGQLPRDYVDLVPGARVELTSRLPKRRLPERGLPAPRDPRPGTGRAEEILIAIQPAFAFAGMKPGQSVLIGDHGLALAIKSVRPYGLSCRVTRGGRVLPRQSVNFPHAGPALPPLTRKDLDDLAFGMSLGVGFVALSFVRSARDVLSLRRRLRGADIGIIAKIETEQALRNIADIIDASDAVLVARGDLAKEVSISQVPVLQKFLIERCNEKAKPVITATQMLESMVVNPEPTRAEASDVANAVLDGSDALMLSAETATGRHPAEAVRVMDSLIRNTERAAESRWIRQRPAAEPEHEIDEMIAYLAAAAARGLNAAAIITFTISGRTALRVAKFRPAIPILAVTPSRGTRVRLGLSYGTVCEEIGGIGNTDDMISGAIAVARRRGMVRRGDTVAITAGAPPHVKGATNLLKLEVVQ
jgi:pyruvate kinase